MTCSPAIVKKVEGTGIIVRLHKLIYKFTDDLKDLVHDIKLEEAIANGEGFSKEVIGTASVLQTFNVTSTRGKKEATVIGSKVMTGFFDTKSKYRVWRDDEILYDNLSLSSLRHLKTTVQKIDKGTECGVIFEKHVELERGDLIESYFEKEVSTLKFVHKAGVSKSY